MAPRAGRLEPWALMSPALALLAAVTALPMLYVLWLSLQQRALFRAAQFAGLDHYLRLATDERFWNALGNTLYFAALSVALELALGLGMALLLERAGRARAFVYGAVLVPWAIPTVVSARMWEWLYNPEVGVLGYLAGRPVNWLGDPALALHAAIAMDVWKSTPFVALLLLAGLQAMPRDLARAAAVDGASAWSAFRRITLPLLGPVILVAAVFRTIDALRVFDAIYVLTGGGPANATETLSIYAYRVLFQMLDFGYGSALAVVVLAITGSAALAYARLLRGAIE
jgi:multiple sugar transport system permease protein